MENRKADLMLVLGCQRSGTTLLAAMLGRHSEIGMLFESTSDDVKRLIGKKYNGNKLLTWRQIRFQERASKFGHLVNRLANFDFYYPGKFHKRKIHPLSELSIQDYIDEGAKIITIKRNKEDVVNSIVRRSKMSRKLANKEYDLAMNEIRKVQDISINITFYELINNTVDTLKYICSKLDIEYESSMLKGPEYNFIYPNKGIRKEKSRPK